MLLKISTTHSPATDLGYLLHKHPDKLQRFPISVGEALVFYPEMREDFASFCLLLEIDPITLVREAKLMAGEGFALRQYVNDRPYVSSSFLSVAISKVLSSALNGRCADRPELLELAMPFDVEVHVVIVRNANSDIIKRFFEPLGYAVCATRHALDAHFPNWGESRYFSLHLQHIISLKQLLTHLYILLPALDSDKHYFVNEHEIGKLLEKGQGWLQEHPERAWITKRYLQNLHSLTSDALKRLEALDASEDLAEDAENKASAVTPRLHDQRLLAVCEQLLRLGARTVLDVGCGEGKLIRELLKHNQFEKITGMDVSYAELLRAKEKLHVDAMSPRQRARIDLIQGSIVYQDDRLHGFDAAAVVEVIEHLDPQRLETFEAVLFGAARPQVVVLTTPNKTYNAVFEKMPLDKMRHHDHRFEWDVPTFESWAKAVAQRHGYTVEFFPLGAPVAPYGSPSQMAVFQYGN